ncbi:MAG: antibiotic biosynthesis monooxygenase [Phyllobacteriaceae bacterium]|nr:antibiotic biosynthesis monooxygenase [Phyllobacteriaceae bacterium]
MIFVIATLTIKPGSLEAILPHARAVIAATQDENGCLAYDMFASVSAPDTLVFVERWQSRSDLSAHSKQPHLKTWREASDPFVVSKVIEIVHPEKIETF